MLKKVSDNMAEFQFKIRTVKEKDYNKERDPYIQALRKAAEPVRLALEALAKDLNIK